VSVHHGSLPANDAGSRPRTSSPTVVCPAISSLFSNKLYSGRAIARYLLVSNSNDEIWPGLLCCHVSGGRFSPVKNLAKAVPLLGLSTTPYLGLSLEHLYRLLPGLVGSMSIIIEVQRAFHTFSTHHLLFWSAPDDPNFRLTGSILILRLWVLSEISFPLS
jgi:hypothetical protein